MLLRAREAGTKGSTCEEPENTSCSAGLELKTGRRLHMFLDDDTFCEYQLTLQFGVRCFFFGLPCVFENFLREWCRRRLGPRPAGGLARLRLRVVPMSFARRCYGMGFVAEIR